MAETCLSPESWRAALDIFVTKPHSVDKRLAGQERLDTYELRKQSIEQDFLFEEKALLEYLSNLHKDDSVIERIHTWLTDLNSSDVSTSNSNTNKVILQKHISRKEKVEHYFQLVIKNENECKIQFVPKVSSVKIGFNFPICVSSRHFPMPCQFLFDGLF